MSTTFRKSRAATLVAIKATTLHRSKALHILHLDKMPTRHRQLSRREARCLSIRVHRLASCHSQALASSCTHCRHLVIRLVLSLVRFIFGANALFQGSSAKSGQFASPPSYPDAAANGSQNQQQFDSYHHVYDQQQAHYTFPHDQSHSGYNQGQQSVGYEYGPRSDTLGYPPDSVSMDPLCVPPPMAMHDGDYVQQYA